jgi:replication factor C subunit 3/5
MALLREIYGAGVEKLKVDVRPFKFKSSTVEITFISSNYHLEMNPSDVGPYRSAPTIRPHLSGKLHLWQL